MIFLSPTSYSAGNCHCLLSGRRIATDQSSLIFSSLLGYEEDGYLQSKMSLAILSSVNSQWLLSAAVTAALGRSCFWLNPACPEVSQQWNSSGLCFQCFLLGPVHGLWASGFSPNQLQLGALDQGMAVETCRQILRPWFFSESQNHRPISPSSPSTL